MSVEKQSINTNISSFFPPLFHLSPYDYHSNKTTTDPQKSTHFTF
jgi:hypothetical protein